MKNIYFFLFVVLLLSNACSWIDKDEQEPAYVYIETFAFSVNSNSEGSSSSNISDAWVYANGTIIGVFELPAKVPILKNGNTTITLSPGIKNNGLGGDRVPYPFYTNYEVNLNLSPFSIDTIKPSSTYRSGLNFWIEDFEGPGLSFTKRSLSDTSLFITNDAAEIFEGTGSGKAVLTSADYFFESIVNNNFINNLPTGGVNVYLEFDYSSTTSFAFGLFGGDNTSQFTNKDYHNVRYRNTTPNSTLVWNKAYIDLREVIGRSVLADTRTLFFDFFNTNSENLFFYIDNVKLIY